MMMLARTGKKPKDNNSFLHLPEDILFYDVLSRLPVKSLLRFRCVSKLWCTTIGDSKFIQTHNMLHTIQNSSSFITGLIQFKPANSKHYIFANRGGYFRFDAQKWSCKVGDSHGLFCFRSKYGFEICNPCTYKFLYHPFPPPPPPHCFTSYGFGFDSLKNEYKVVQIGHGNGNFHRCMVFTLGTNKNSWKDVTVASNLLVCLNYFPHKGLSTLKGFVNSDEALYSNGALHWFSRPAHIILSFDIHYEKFSLIRGPSPATLYKNCCCYFVEWQGCICVAFHNLPRNVVYLFRYMLKEHHHLDDNRPQEDVWDHTIIHLKCKPTSAIRFVGSKSLLYWFFEGYVSVYATENGYLLKVKYELPPGLDFSLTCDFELKYHIENLLSLQSFVPSQPSQAGTKKERLVVQVKSVPSL